MTERGQIILAGRIAINQRDDNIVWENNIGRVALSNLCFYLGESSFRITSLPEEISIVSHVTGKTLKFRHEPLNLNPNYEIYTANQPEHGGFNSGRILLVIEATPEQLDRLRKAAIHAKAERWDSKFS